METMPDRMLRWQVRMLTAFSLVQLVLSAKRGQENASSPLRGNPQRRGFRPLAKPTGSEDYDYAHAYERRLYDLPMRDSPLRPDYFQCETSTCGRHEKFYELTDERTQTTTAARQCDGALSTAMATFGKYGVEQCKSHSRSKVTWNECRIRYCDMYDKIVMDVTNGTQYYLGSDCHPLLQFNKTICETYYNDQLAFCDCICPALPLLEDAGTTEACEEAILLYVFFGKHAKHLLQKFPMSALCSKYLCIWMESISDPRNRVKDAPDKCLEYNLPFQRSQCTSLLQRSIDEPVYNPCPWEQPSTKDFIMNCTDGTACDVRVDSWACCQRHASRAQCPKNFPVMCADPLECVGESDHCCVEERIDCASGVRGCSPVMAPGKEWTGKVPDNVPAYIGPTTTMSMKEWMAYLSRQPKATTQPSSWGDDLLPYLPYVLVPIILVGIIGSIVACFVFGGDTWKAFMKAVFGADRFFTVCQMDVVHKFSPNDIVQDWDELPPRITQEDIERIKADEAACQFLADACQAAFALGRASLVNVHWATGYGPQQESAAIREAVAGVRARGLQDVGDNARLIEEGEHWCNNLAMETSIVASMEDAFPLLSVDFKKMNPAPMPGAPWAGTTVGHALDCDKRREVWGHIETISQALKIAIDGGVSEGLVGQGKELVRELIARHPELPADRCVLDPAGKGVKLLPKGHQRALWYHTGDSYLYEPEKEKQKGAELNNFDLPPNEYLVDTSVDPCRPVCATFATTKNCKLGKRCPWRHTKPLKGDVIREPIGFR